MIVARQEEGINSKIFQNNSSQLLLLPAVTSEASDIQTLILSNKESNSIKKQVEIQFWKPQNVDSFVTQSIGDVTNDLNYLSLQYYQGIHWFEINLLSNFENFNVTAKSDTACSSSKRATSTSLINRTIIFDNRKPELVFVDQKFPFDES